MGVINLTPNSFSDGGQYNSIDTFTQKFKALQNWAKIIDIGAESTAPFNSPISMDEEIKRYQNIFFPLLHTMDDPQMILSIDTYKVDVFKCVYYEAKKYWPKSKIIFNDVSGKIDDELNEILGDASMDFEYVMSHNLCPERVLTSHHMDYICRYTGDDLIKHMIDYFMHAYEKLKGKRNFYFDPCFGFSKSRVQNQYLLKYFKTFLLQLPIEVPVIYGISKKSFLRVPKEIDIKNKKQQDILDQIQSILFFDLVKENFKREIYFRVHGPNSLQACFNLQQIFDI